jgi:hypothetical protein|eukprot:COSAG01_NODE_891_length_12911_cov_99.327740_9_plen_83_part_00
MLCGADNRLTLEELFERNTLLFQPTVDFSALIEGASTALRRVEQLRAYTTDGQSLEQLCVRLCAPLLCDARPPHARMYSEHA